MTETELAKPGGLNYGAIRLGPEAHVKGGEASRFPDGRMFSEKPQVLGRLF